VGGPERKSTERPNAFTLKQSSDTREASLPFEKRNDQRLLVFVDPRRQRFFRLELRRRNGTSRRLENTKNRPLPRWIVLNAIEHVKLHDAPELAHKRLKQLCGIAMHTNRSGYAE
jgi:hypothetical protein